MIKEIEVTQNDIDQGKPERCFECPISLAIQRHLKPEYQARVATFGVLFRQGHQWLTETELPAEARSFIKQFDWPGQGARYVHPFKFPLDIPDEYLVRQTTEAA